METLVLTAHVVVAIIIVILILLQHGKGADAGTTFGAGNAGSVFGASGSSSFLSRSTAILTAFFFASSLGLAVIAKNKAKGSHTLDTTEESVDVAPSTKKTEKINAEEKSSAALPVPEKDAVKKEEKSN